MSAPGALINQINQINQRSAKLPTGSDIHLHVHVRRLEAALVDVVVCEGLRWVRAVLVYRDGHLRVGGASACHNADSWGHGKVSGGQQIPHATQRASLNARRPKSGPEGV